MTKFNLAATAATLKRNGFSGAAERLIELEAENERLRAYIRKHVGATKPRLDDPPKDEGYMSVDWKYRD